MHHCDLHVSQLVCSVQGSAFFLIGVFLILIKWALVGICVEAYGFWALFSGFFPTILGFLRRLPVLGSVLDLPVLKTVRCSFDFLQVVIKFPLYHVLVLLCCWLDREC